MNAPVQIGDILASKYRVEEVLGAGAMGVVVAARHVRLGSAVALKFMLPEAMAVHGASERFIREARAAACLRGEHVTRVTDFGELETGAPYIVMELLEGADLDAVVHASGPLPIEEALAYVMDACIAMDEAHQAGIVHRDLKPKNLFLTRRPDGSSLIKVLDFGTSKWSDTADDAPTSTTRTGSVLGSPEFMSPEQIKGAKHVDARTDIYALGALLHYLLTKNAPFAAGSVGELFACILHKAPSPLRRARPDAPAALEAIVSRCLEKDPYARFQSAKALITALRPVLDATKSSSAQKLPKAAPARSTLGNPLSLILVGLLSVLGSCAIVMAGALIFNWKELGAPILMPAATTPQAADAGPPVR